MRWHLGAFWVIYMDFKQIVFTILSDKNIVIFKYRNQIIYYRDNFIFNKYDDLRIVRILQGYSKWVIGNCEYDVAAGDIVLLNNIHQRAHKLIPEGSPLIHEVIEFLPILAFPYGDILDIFYNRNGEYSRIIRNDNENYIRLNELFNFIISEVRGDNKRYRDELILSYMQSLLFTISRAFSVEINKDGNIYNQVNYRMIVDTITYIKSNFPEKLSVDVFTEKYNINRSAFSKIFNRINGMSFPDYVRRCRINNVIDLMKHKDYPIIEAAFESGFNSVSGFYKAFRDVTGLSPSDIIK